MRARTTLLVSILSLLISGCMGHYRYESRGSVTTSSGESSNAILYWFADDGRLWYGKSYKQVDSGLEMNVCNATSKQFVPAGDDNTVLQLPSRSGDRQVAHVVSSGEMVRLPEPTKLKPGNSCGRISVTGSAVSTEDLSEGAKPEVILLCENVSKPDRYPEIGRYEFKAITKTKVKENLPPDIVCPAQ